MCQTMTLCHDSPSSVIASPRQVFLCTNEVNARLSSFRFGSPEYPIGSIASSLYDSGTPSTVPASSGHDGVYVNVESDLSSKARVKYPIASQVLSVVYGISWLENTATSTGASVRNGFLQVICFELNHSFRSGLTLL